MKALYRADRGGGIVRSLVCSVMLGVDADMFIHSGDYLEAVNFAIRLV